MTKGQDRPKKGGGNQPKLTAKQKKQRKKDKTEDKKPKSVVDSG